MTFLPPYFLDTVVALGTRSETNEVSWAASGFLYGSYSETRANGHKYYGVYLVTNRHVLKGQKKLCLRFNPVAEEPARTYDIELEDSSGDAMWFTSAKTDSDAAVVPIDANLLKDDGIRFAMFKSDQNVATVDKMRELQISEGDFVFLLGFPMGLVGEERNYVVCRSGSIARIRDTLAGLGGGFLIDASVFPGSSGGPVVLKPEADSIGGTKPVGRAYLLGVVSAYIPYYDEAISRQTGQTRVMFAENSGLGVVQPVDLVDEAVQAHREWVTKERRSTISTQSEVVSGE